MRVRPHRLMSLHWTESPSLPQEDSAPARHPLPAVGAPPPPGFGPVPRRPGLGSRQPQSAGDALGRDGEAPLWRWLAGGKQLCECSASQGYEAPRSLRGAPGLGRWRATRRGGTTRSRGRSQCIVHVLACIALRCNTCQFLHITDAEKRRYEVARTPTPLRPPGGQREAPLRLPPPISDRQGASPLHEGESAESLSPVRVTPDPISPLTSPSHAGSNRLFHQSESGRIRSPLSPVPDPIAPITSPRRKVNKLR